MSTVQLRRYAIQEGEMEAFVEWWRTLVPIREKHGFKVLFAMADQQRNEFIWAISHDGDFAGSESDYLSSPERAAAVAGAPNLVTEVFVSMPLVEMSSWV